MAQARAEQYVAHKHAHTHLTLTILCPISSLLISLFTIALFISNTCAHKADLQKFTKNKQTLIRPVGFLNINSPVPPNKPQT